MKNYLFILLFFTSCTSNYYHGYLTNSVKLDTIRGKDFISISATSEAIITYLDSTTKSQTKIELLQIPIVKFFDTIYYDSLRIKDSTVTKIETKIDTKDSIIFYDSLNLITVFDTIKRIEIIPFYPGSQYDKYKVMIFPGDVYHRYGSIIIEYEIVNFGPAFFSHGALNDSVNVNLFEGIGYEIQLYDSAGIKLHYSKGIYNQFFDIVSRSEFKFVFGYGNYESTRFDKGKYTMSLFSDEWNDTIVTETYQL